MYRDDHHGKHKAVLEISSSSELGKEQMKKDLFIKTISEELYS